MSVFQSCDSFNDFPHAIQFIPIIVIKYVAYFLPSISTNDRDSINYGKYFYSSCENNRNFMIMQPVERWI